jgi:hypothetical protein
MGSKGITAGLLVGLTCVVGASSALADARQALSLRREAVALTERQVPLVGDLRWVRWPPDDDKDRRRWVLEFEGSYTVPSSCGGAWQGGRSLITLVVPNGMMTLISKPGARAAITFKTQDDLARCLGVGTRLRFSSGGWTPFFEHEYRGGGFVIEPTGLKFLAHTFVRTEGGQLWISNGWSWLEQEHPYTATRGPFIRQAQLRLLDLGIDPGPIDGRFGRRVAGALRHYQRAEGLPITGQLDKATFERLGIR